MLEKDNQYFFIFFYIIIIDDNKYIIITFKLYTRTGFENTFNRLWFFSIPFTLDEDTGEDNYFGNDNEFFKKNYYKNDDEI